MTARERVLTALRHQEPDRIPVTLAYETPEAILQQYGKLPADLPMRQDIYAVAAAQPTPPDAVRERYFHDIALPHDTWFDGWGVARWRSSTGESLRTVGPLREAESVADIEAFPWPDVGAEHCVAGLGDRVAALHAQGVAVQGVGGSIFEYAWYMFGMERLMMALYSDVEVALRLFDKITERLIITSCHCARAGVDILRLGDDIADQRGMMIAPELWRATLKPRLASIIAAARAIQPDIPVFYHSDGNVSAVIDDLIEVGVTILNPVQPEAMDPFEVKRRYGDRLTLWGTIGTQTVLPFYTPEDVRRTVKEYCAVLGKGGGYIIGPTHSLERDVPWENIEAFYRAVEEYGVYH
ncbi:MAG TPA: uroporphyrinogen decarboxylase family protein [Armatimonadota bacterium]